MNISSQKHNDIAKSVGVYHKDCTDGTTAAAVLLKRFPDAQVFPLEHGYSEEDFAPIREAVDKDTTVYIVDAAFGARELADRAKEVIVIDHHIGAQEEMEALAGQYGNVAYVFDNEKSGASLAWRYFFGEDSIPELITLVEDLDLFRWKHGEKTKAIGSSSAFFFNKPEMLVPYLSGSSLGPLLERGEVIAQFIDKLIEEYIARAEPFYLRIGAHNVPAYNAAGLLRSSLGHHFAKEHGVAVAVFGITGTQVKISFRSEGGQTPSARELAETLGGGGHEKASGARVSLEQFCEMISR